MKLEVVLILFNFLAKASFNYFTIFSHSKKIWIKILKGTTCCERLSAIDMKLHCGGRRERLS